MNKEIQAIAKAVKQHIYMMKGRGLTISCPSFNKTSELTRDVRTVEMKWSSARQVPESLIAIFLLIQLGFLD